MVSTTPNSPASGPANGPESARSGVKDESGPVCTYAPAFAESIRAGITAGLIEPVVSAQTGGHYGCVYMTPEQRPRLVLGDRTFTYERGQMEAAQRALDKWVRSTGGPVWPGVRPFMTPVTGFAQPIRY